MTLQLNDATDYSIIVGKTDGLIPSAYKGRGLVAMDRVYEFQTAYAKDSANLRETIIEFCDGLAKIRIHLQRAFLFFPIQWIVTLSAITSGIFRVCLSESRRAA